MQSVGWLFNLQSAAFILQPITLNYIFTHSCRRTHTHTHPIWINTVVVCWRCPETELSLCPAPGWIYKKGGITSGVTTVQLINTYGRSLYAMFRRAAGSKVRNFSGTVTRLRVRAFVQRGNLEGFFLLQSCLSLVFTTFADRLLHLHMNRIEQHFNSTTDTLLLSGPRWDWNNFGHDTRRPFPN